MNDAFYINPGYVVSVSALEQGVEGGDWRFTISFTIEAHVPSYTMQFADRREAAKAHGAVIEHMREKENA